MSTFYLLPPRPLVGSWLARTFEALVPGLQWPGSSNLADLLTAATADRGDVFLVHREDLPAGEEPARALVQGFGAEPGDEVIEVTAGPAPGALASRRWRVETGS